jgi:hypothetical protein
MNRRKIQKMPPASIVRLDPPVLHFDENENRLPMRDHDWQMGSTDVKLDQVELRHIGSGEYRYLLFLDRIIKFQEADLHYPLAPKQGLLILNVQVVVIGDGLVQERILRGRKPSADGRLRLKRKHTKHGDS